jgi:hypothetical protein
MCEWNRKAPLLWLELFLLTFTPPTLFGSSRYGGGRLIFALMPRLINPLMNQIREFKQLDFGIFRFRTGPGGK